MHLSVVVDDAAIDDCSVSLLRSVAESVNLSEYSIAVLKPAGHDHLVDEWELVAEAVPFLFDVVGDLLIPVRFFFPELLHPCLAGEADGCEEAQRIEDGCDVGEEGSFGQLLVRKVVDVQPDPEFISLRVPDDAHWSICWPLSGHNY